MDSLRTTILDSSSCPKKILFVTPNYRLYAKLLTQDLLTKPLTSQKSRPV